MFKQKVFEKAIIERQALIDEASEIKERGGAGDIEHLQEIEKKYLSLYDFFFDENLDTLEAIDYNISKEMQANAMLARRIIKAVKSNIDALNSINTRDFRSYHAELMKEFYNTSHNKKWYIDNITQMLISKLNKGVVELKDYEYKDFEFLKKEFLEIAEKNGFTVAIQRTSEDADEVECVNLKEFFQEDLSSIITIAEASNLYKVDTSTLRHAIANNKLKDGIDCRQSGRTWLIRKSAMEREYGEG